MMAIVGLRPVNVSLGNDYKKPLTRQVKGFFLRFPGLIGAHASGMSDTTSPRPHRRTMAISNDKKFVDDKVHSLK